MTIEVGHQRADADHGGTGCPGAVTTRRPSRVSSETCCKRFCSADYGCVSWRFRATWQGGGGLCWLVLVVDR
jgi:hypothetical protein